MASRALLLVLVIATILLGIAVLWLMAEALLFVLIGLIFLFGTFAYLWLFFLYRKDFFNDPLPEKWPNISIIIPAYNESKTIAKTIRAVKNLYYDGKLDILVVDDGSKDNTFAIAKKFSGIRVFSQPNSGKAVALNLGIQKAKYDLIATLDADSFPKKNALRFMVGYFANPHVAGVSSSTAVRNAVNFWQKLQAIEYVFNNFVRKLNSFIHAQYVTPGPLSIFRKSKLIEAGGFDGTALTEDIDMALNMLSRKYIIAHSMNAKCETLAPGTFKTVFKQRERWFRGGMMCTRKYIRLFFNFDYNYLGFFVFPFAFVINAVFLAFYILKAIMVVGLAAINFLVSVYTAFRLNYLNWEIFFGRQPDIINIINIETVFFTALFAMSLLYFVLVFKKSRQSFEARRFPFFFLFLFYWSFFMGLLWFVSFGKEIIGAKRTW